MEERTTGTLPGDNRQTGTLPIDRQTGTLPIDNQGNRVTSTLQSDINSNNKYYDNDEDEYIYDIEIGEVIRGDNDSYTIIEQFSYGGQAEIYKVQTVLGEIYIAKIYRVRKQNRYSDDIVEFLSKNTKSGIIKLIDHGIYKNRYFYIFPIYNGGSLDLHKPDFSNNESRLKRYIRVLNEALNCIHEAGFIHSDIKPANMLIDNENDIPIISDFGSVTKGNENVSDNRSITFADGKVSDGYLAPDAAVYAAVSASMDNRKRIAVAKKTDYFALGVSLCEMYVKDIKYRLFRSNEEIVLRFKDDNVVYPKEVEDNKRFLNLIQALLSYDPNVRAGYSEVNDWLEGKELQVYSTLHGVNLFKHYFIDQEYTSPYDLAVAYAQRDWDATIRDVFRQTLYNAFEKYDEKIYSKILDIREDNQSVEERPISAFKIICNIAPEIKFFWNGRLYKNNEEVAEAIYQSVKDEDKLFDSLFTSKALRVFYEVNDKRKIDIDAIDDVLNMSEESVARAQLYYAELLSPGIIIRNVTNGICETLDEFIDLILRSLDDNGFDKAIECRKDVSNEIITYSKLCFSSEEINALLIRHGLGNKLINTSLKYSIDKEYYSIIRFLEVVYDLSENKSIIEKIKESFYYKFYTSFIDVIDDYDFYGSAISVKNKIKEIADKLVKYDENTQFFARYIHFFDDVKEQLSYFSLNNTTGIVFIQELSFLDKKMYNPYTSCIIPKSDAYKLVNIKENLYLPRLIAEKMIYNGYAINIKEVADRAEILDYVFKCNLKKVEQFYDQFKKCVTFEKIDRARRHRVNFFSILGIVDLLCIVLLSSASLDYFYYKNTYSYEINVWIWCPVLIILLLVLGIIILFRYKRELRIYKKKRKRRKLIKQSELMRQCIQEMQEKISNKEYDKLSDNTHKFIQYSQQNISNYLNKLIESGVETTFYQDDRPTIRFDILLMVFIIVCLSGTLWWNKVSSDKIKVLTYNDVLLSDNLPNEEDLFNVVDYIYKMDLLTVEMEWKKSFDKLMDVQEDCLLQGDYERLNSFLPVYNLFAQGTKNLNALIDSDYYGIIESNDNINKKLIAHSIYNDYKKMINKYRAEDIVFEVKHEEDIYDVWVHFDYSLYHDDYNISTAKENKDDREYNHDLSIEYNLSAEEWTYENVMNILLAN